MGGCGPQRRRLGSTSDEPIANLCGDHRQLTSPERIGAQRPCKHDAGEITHQSRQPRRKNTTGRCRRSGSNADVEHRSAQQFLTGRSLLIHTFLSHSRAFV